MCQQDLLAGVIGAYSLNGSPLATFLLVGCRNRHFRDDGFARKHWTEELERHFASDEVQVAADFRRLRRGEQPLHHHSPDGIGRYVVRASVTGERTELEHIVELRCPLPREALPNG
jgi:hypothetical protein